MGWENRWHHRERLVIMEFEQEKRDVLAHDPAHPSAQFCPFCHQPLQDGDCRNFRCRNFRFPKTVTHYCMA